MHKVEKDIFASGRFPAGSYFKTPITQYTSWCLFVHHVSAKFPLPSSSAIVPDSVQPFLIYSWLKQRESGGDSARMQKYCKRREKFCHLNSRPSLAIVVAFSRCRSTPRPPFVLARSKLETVELFLAQFHFLKARGSLQKRGAKTNCSWCTEWLSFLTLCVFCTQSHGQQSATSAWVQGWYRYFLSLRNPRRRPRALADVAVPQCFLGSANNHMTHEADRSRLKKKNVRFSSCRCKLLFSEQ